MGKHDGRGHATATAVALTGLLALAGIGLAAPVHADGLGGVSGWEPSPTGGGINRPGLELERAVLPSCLRL